MLGTILNIKKKIIINQYEKVIFCSNKNIEYESTGHRSKSLSVEGYLNKIRPDFIKS